MRDPIQTFHDDQVADNGHNSQTLLRRDKGVGRSEGTVGFLPVSPNRRSVAIDSRRVSAVLPVVVVAAVRPSNKSSSDTRPGVVRVSMAVRATVFFPSSASKRRRDGTGRGRRGKLR